MQPWRGLLREPTKWVVFAILLFMKPSITNSFFALPSSDTLDQWLGMFNLYSSTGSSDTTNIEETSTAASLISKTKMFTSSTSVQQSSTTTSQPSTALTTKSPRLYRFFQYFTPDVYAGTKSIFTEYVNSLTGAYTLIVKDYVADYYTNAIKSYTRATLKVKIIKSGYIFNPYSDVWMGFIRRVPHSQRTCP